ncbi:MAG TPA: LPS assembly protein LptD [Rhizomicrobium sp.]|jgi:LPS-assembly protein
MRLAGRGAVLVVASAAALAPAVVCSAGPLLGSKEALLGKGNGQMLLTADKVDYDTQSGVATARGHVEIDYNRRIITADTVTYDGNKDIASAAGHVVMMAPNGDVAFAEHAELTDQMKNGVLDAFSARLGKYGRLVALRARREKNGTVTVGTRTAFTPCKICAQEPVPVWQVNAERAVHDSTTHKITYENAVLEMLGIPVAWTPYFSQSDGTVKHETGLLTPELGSSSLLGSFVRLPYYFSFSDSEDATIAPLFSTKGGEQLEGEYRQRFDRGGMWLQASIANDPHGGLLQNQDQTYSSLFGSGTRWLSDIWHVGYDVQLSSNDTYLQRYNLSPDQRLVSDLYLEGISGRSRLEITGYFFQGLMQEDRPRTFPVVLPYVQYTYIPLRDVLGGQFRFDFNTAAVTREGDIADSMGTLVPQLNSQRATAEARWRLPVVTDNGQLLTFQLDVRGDIYHTTDGPIVNPPSTPLNNQYIYRGLPYAAVDWRWPFITSTDGVFKAIVLEPIVQGIAAPYGGNPQGIPNDDSQDFELNEMDIFSFQPVPGYDVVETGPRANVGIRANTFFPAGNAELIVGEQFRLKPDPALAQFTGFENQNSDIVTRFTLNLPPHLSFVHRLDIDPSFGKVVRDEAYVNAHWGHTSLQMSYLRVPPSELEATIPPQDAGLTPPLFPDTNSREEINGQATVGITDYWLVYAAARRDLETSQMLYSEFGVGYEDECLGVSLAYRRQYVRDRDIPPSTSILLRVNLKSSDNAEDTSNIFPRAIFSEEPL